MPSSNNIVASAILAVYNAESTIEACLDSLLAQSLPIEIIMVDDGSTDNTKSLMVRTIELYPNAKITLLHQNHLGPATARNLGSHHATTNILLFVDADMTFDPDYVKDLISPIKEGQVIGTYTVEERVSNWDNIWARCWNIEEGWQDKKRFPANPPQFGTDFRAILKAEFIRVGGFDHIGYTDTWSLFHKLGVRPLSTRAVCYHQNPGSLSAVLRQARWSAKRPYKYGALGRVYALLRASLPISLLVATFKSLLHKNIHYFVFKLVYDWGRLTGILQMMSTGNLAK